MIIGDLDRKRLLEDNFYRVRVATLFSRLDRHRITAETAEIHHRQQRARDAFDAAREDRDTVFDGIAAQ